MGEGAVGYTGMHASYACGVGWVGGQCPAKQYDSLWLYSLALCVTENYPKFMQEPTERPNLNSPHVDVKEACSIG